MDSRHDPAHSRPQRPEVSLRARDAKRVTWSYSNADQVTIALEHVRWYADVFSHATTDALQAGELVGRFGGEGVLLLLTHVLPACYGSMHLEDTRPYLICCRFLSLLNMNIVYALVAQWIEQRFPKPCVARSSRAEGARFVVAGLSHSLL